MRLDIYLTENAMAKSRTSAQELIKSGSVTVNGSVCSKPSTDVTSEDKVEITGEQLRYVGRGGLKLEGAIKGFDITLDSLTCLDIGASTGGFTDCMLQNGAAMVYAVDVGHDQLAEKLRTDSRVISMEKTDIRSCTLPSEVDFVGTDVSFISLKQILPHIMRLLKRGGKAVVLIKPQFEVGKKALNKKGIVKDEKTRIAVVEDIKQFSIICGFAVEGIQLSPISGGDGNIEYLMYLRKE